MTHHLFGDCYTRVLKRLESEFQYFHGPGAPRLMEDVNTDTPKPKGFKILSNEIVVPPRKELNKVDESDPSPPPPPKN